MFEIYNTMDYDHAFQNNLNQNYLYKNPGEKVRNQALLLISDTQSRTDRSENNILKFWECLDLSFESIFHRDQDNVNFRLKERLRLCRAWRFLLFLFKLDVQLLIHGPVNWSRCWNDAKWNGPCVLANCVSHVYFPCVFLMCISHVYLVGATSSRNSTWTRRKLPVCRLVGIVFALHSRDKDRDKDKDK